jgi:hypothetical protein
MFDNLKRQKLVKETAAALNRLPFTRARPVAAPRFTSSNEPDIIAVSHGRVFFFGVRLPLEDVETAKEHDLERWSLTGASVAYVDSVLGALSIVEDATADAYIDENSEKVY